MDDTLRSLLRELEGFGATNDARASTRHQKMLNITPETGELLAILVQSAKARRVLEIGTSNGYSTLWLAEAVKAISGNVVTVEVSVAKAEMARRNLERSGLFPWVRQEVTEAGRFLGQQPPANCDLLFLDADREQYVAWWPWIQSVLAPGGLLVVDNAVSHAAEMEGFIAEVRATPGWRSLVVPIGNGEFVAVKPVQGSAAEPAATADQGGHSGVRSCEVSEAGPAAERGRSAEENA
jgi:predicted O-methyltransferase YrrM